MGVRCRYKVGLPTLLMLLSPCGIGQDALTDATAETQAEVTKKTAKRPGYHTQNFRIRPSISITEIYDSNVFATDRNTESDWITLISPRLRADSTWSRHSLRFKIGADAGRYWENDAENYLDYWANAEGRLNLNDRTDLFAGLGLSFEHEGRDSPDARLGGQEPTTFRSVHAHAGIETVVADTTYRLGATYEDLNFDNVGAGSGLLFNDDRDREARKLFLKRNPRAKGHWLHEGKWERYFVPLPKGERWDEKPGKN